MKTIRDMYLRRTRIGAKALDELMDRDLMLRAERCLELGMCDRVLSLGAPTARPRLASGMNTDVMLRKTNLNQVRLECNDVNDFAVGAARRLDELIGSGPARSLKPVVLHADGLSCLMGVIDQVAPVAARMAVLSRMTDTYGIIDTAVDLVNLLPILMCRRRVMYKHAYIVVHMLYFREGSWMIRDAFENTNLVMDMIRELLSRRTQLPADIIANIDKRRILLSPQDCLRYGIVDQIIE
jgi:hypothetical protein